METREIIDPITALTQVLIANGMNRPDGPWSGEPWSACEAANKKIVELIEKLKP